MEENSTSKSRFQQSSEKGKTQSGRFQGTSGGKNKKKVNYSGGYQNKASGWDNSFLYVLAAVFIILPLIVRAKVYDPRLSEFDWFSATKSALDVFLYYKQAIFVVILFVMLACIAGSLFCGKRKFTFPTIFIPLGIYAGFSLLSTFFSEYRSYGISGIFEQFESVFCLLGYAVLVYFAYSYVKNEKDVRWLINALAIGALIIGVIGTFQGLKLDLFRTGFGKGLIATSQVPASSLTFSFAVGRAYVTLFNPNYVGVYCTLIIPVFAVLIPYAKTLAERVLYSAVTITMIISMFAAQFKAGIVSLAIVGVIILILLRKKLFKFWYITVTVVAAVIGMFVIVDLVNEHNYSNSIKAAFKVEKTATPVLTEITTQKDKITFTYNQQKYALTVQDYVMEDGSITYGDFKVAKEDGTAIEVYTAEDQSCLLLKDANLQTFSIVNVPSINGFSVTIDAKPWYFVKRNDGFKYYNMYGKEAVIETAETALFDGYEGLASKRGFIWARTLPLLKKYFIFGSGADTFSIAFPQFDYVSFYNHGYGEQLISKPHCWYLQVGVQTGVISLVALLVFYGIYMVDCIRLYVLRSTENYLSQVGVAIFVGTIGYMIAGLTNDSSVTVAPVFWGVIGIGVAINAMVKEQVK